jgi:hypothetical protein
MPQVSLALPVRGQNVDGLYIVEVPMQRGHMSHSPPPRGIAVHKKCLQTQRHTS